MLRLHIKRKHKREEFCEDMSEVSELNFGGGRLLVKQIGCLECSVAVACHTLSSISAGARELCGGWTKS